VTTENSGDFYHFFGNEKYFWNKCARKWCQMKRTADEPGKWRQKNKSADIMGRKIRSRTQGWQNWHKKTASHEQ
jgi:hypothetical protein